MLNNQTLTDYIAEHCTQSMSDALAAERHRPLRKRHCTEVTDCDFIRLGLLRSIVAATSCK